MDLPVRVPMVSMLQRDGWSHHRCDAIHWHWCLESVNQLDKVPALSYLTSCFEDVVLEWRQILKLSQIKVGP